jgi:hypothetical protein
MTLCICLRCGDEYHGDVFALKFCDDCFDELVEPGVAEEDYYTELHPERGLWWDATLRRASEEEEELN